MVALAVQSLDEIQRDISEHWWVYVSIPLVAAFIGYTTKLLAIEMIYRPLEFKGIGPIGWQGLVPRRAAKVGAIAIEQLTSSLLKPEELIDRLDPDDLVAQLEEPLTQAVQEIAQDIAEAVRPGLWEGMPDVARRAVIARARSRAPIVVANVLEDVRANTAQFIDLKYLAVQTLVRNKATLNQLMRKTGGPAMVFVRNVGIPFGLAIGTVQAVAWGLFHEPLIMPLFGLFTGFASDWLALNMLFSPRTPSRYLGLFKWQGLLHQKREQISRDYAQVMAVDLFSPDILMQAVLEGPGSDRLFATVTREIEAAIDAEAGVARPAVRLAIGSTRYNELKQTVARKAIERVRDVAPQVEGYAADRLAIEETIAEKLQLLDEEGYESILRPIFKDDEWLMITMGAALGFAVGEVQVLLVEHFAGG